MLGTLCRFKKIIGDILNNKYLVVLSAKLEFIIVNITWPFLMKHLRNK